MQSSLGSSNIKMDLMRFHVSWMIGEANLWGSNGGLHSVNDTDHCSHAGS